MHLTVDDPREHELAAGVEGGFRGWCGAGPDRSDGSDGSVGDAEIASGEHAIRKHEVAANHEIEHVLLSDLAPVLDAPGGGAT